MTETITPTNPILFIRMSTGEDIITEVIEINGNSITILNPFKIVYRIDKDLEGVMYLELMHWVFPSLVEKQSFTIDTKNILIMHTPNESLIKRYNNQIEDFAIFMKEKESMINSSMMDVSDTETFNQLLQDLNTVNVDDKEKGNTSPVIDKRVLH